MTIIVTIKRKAGWRGAYSQIVNLKLISGALIDRVTYRTEFGWNTQIRGKGFADSRQQKVVITSHRDASCGSGCWCLPTYEEARRTRI